jgi:hypothetical protein
MSCTFMHGIRRLRAARLVSNSGLSAEPRGTLDLIFRYLLPIVHNQAKMR